MLELAHKLAKQTYKRSASVFLTQNQREKQQDLTAADERVTEDSGAQMKDIFQFDDNPLKLSCWPCCWQL